MADRHGNPTNAELDREVVRCQICGLVQYRTRTDNCRRCLRLLPPKVRLYFRLLRHKICRATTVSCSRIGRTAKLWRISASASGSCANHQA